MKAKQNERPVNLQADYNIWDAKAWLSQGMTLTDVPPMIVTVLRDEFDGRLHDEFVYEDGRYYRKISLAPLPPNPEYTKPTVRDITSEIDIPKLRRDIAFAAGACGFGSDPTVIL